MAKSTTTNGSTLNGVTSPNTKTGSTRPSAPGASGTTGGKSSWSASSSAKDSTKNTPVAGGGNTITPKTAAPRSGSPAAPTRTYVVDRNIPAPVQATMAQIPQPTYVPPPRTDGAPNVTVEIRRAPESIESAGRVDRNALGRDVVIFYNHDTGEAFQLPVQTVSNVRDGKTGTIAPGPIALRLAAPGTSMPQPETVMTIVEGQTIGGGRLNEHGQAVYPDGRTTLPYRVHRDVNDYRNPGLKNLPTSAGCFTFIGDSLYIANKRLASWGVERGATITGWVIQQQRR